tara:strand:+ start:471 stop:671 length:201 start_codon:yes stop_codon:yes gene_type:complete
MIEVGELVTWTIKESLEWADPPIAVVTDTMEDTSNGKWYRVTFLTGYRAEQTFELREQQIRRIDNE